MTYSLNMPMIKQIYLKNLPTTKFITQKNLNNMKLQKIVRPKNLKLNQKIKILKHPCKKFKTKSRPTLPKLSPPLLPNKSKN